MDGNDDAAATITGTTGSAWSLGYHRGLRRAPFRTGKRHGKATGKATTVRAHEGDFATVDPGASRGHLVMSLVFDQPFTKARPFVR